MWGGVIRIEILSKNKPPPLWEGNLMYREKGGVWGVGCVPRTTPDVVPVLSQSFLLTGIKG